MAAVVMEVFPGWGVRVIMCFGDVEEVGVHVDRHHVLLIQIYHSETGIPVKVGCS